MVSEQPSVSVVVPTHNRRALLERLVRALEAQENAPAYEVVVVDDGSVDGSYDELERLAAASGVTLVPVRLDTSGGPAVARNTGWRTARAPRVAFIDDDCVPDRAWVAALTNRLEDADIVQGRTVPDPDQVDGRPYSYSITVEGQWGYYEACNIAYRRDVLERLGGFDEAFRYDAASRRGQGPIYGEDVDLAWRAIASGARVVFEPEALVLHDVRARTFREHLRDRHRWEGIVRAVEKNPRLRERCHGHWFWVRSHPWALLAAAGVGVAAASKHRTGRLTGAALVWPYVRFRTRVVPVGRIRQWPATIPLSLVNDLVDVAVFARASLRHRTLVL